MKNLRLQFLLAIMIYSMPLFAQDDMIALMMKNFPANFAGTLDERYLTSKEGNSTYLIYIYLPISYYENQNKYPLLILTDAQMGIGIAKTSLDFLAFGGEIKEVIMVGIGYPPSSGLDIGRKRFRDMTPTHVKGYDPSGSADTFLSYIKNELFPFIEKNYRVDMSDRCYVGISLGGLLGGHILIEQPQLFNHYIIGSPSYWWDNKEITKRLSGKNIIALDSVKTVYTYMGSKEGPMMIDPWDEFNNIIVNKLNKNVKFHIQIFQDETHMSASLAAFSTAIKFVYGK